MPFLKLNRFLPATKAWKMFASKFQRKSPKLNTSSKPIKKPYKSRYSKKSSNKRISWLRLCVQPNKFKHKKNLSKTLVYRHHFHTNPSPPVSVDQLFSVIEEVPPVPASAVAEKKIPPSSTATATATSTANMDPLCNQDEGEAIGVSGNQDSADHMWESLVLASPQLNQINERADEFIARFRHDMLLQERLARHL